MSRRVSLKDIPSSTGTVLVAYQSQNQIQEWYLAPIETIDVLSSSSLNF
jgi:hypothetical protein